MMKHAIVRILHAEPNFFELQQQQNLGQIFGTSEMHLSCQVALAAVSSVVVDLLLIVTPIVGFFGCSVFWCALLCVHSSFAII